MTLHLRKCQCPVLDDNS